MKSVKNGWYISSSYAMGSRNYMHLLFFFEEDVGKRFFNLNSYDSAGQKPNLSELSSSSSVFHVDSQLLDYILINYESFIEYDHVKYGGKYISVKDIILDSELCKSMPGDNFVDLLEVIEMLKRLVLFSNEKGVFSQPDAELLVELLSSINDESSRKEGLFILSKAFSGNQDLR